MNSTELNSTVGCRQGALCSRLAMKASRSFAASAPGVEHPDLGCVEAHAAKADALQRCLQLGFQVQNDIAEQTCRERIGGLPLHRSIARHLISALLPTLAVSHGDVPPCSDPQRRRIGSPNWGIIAARKWEPARETQRHPNDSSDQGSIGRAIAPFACDGIKSLSDACASAEQCVAALMQAAIDRQPEDNFTLAALFVQS
jgi:hypothetical protein